MIRNRASFSSYKNIFIIIGILCTAVISTDGAAAVTDKAPKEQYFTVGNNGAVLAVASFREITRISFLSSVVDINAIAGELEYSVNGRDVFLRTNSEKPVNFFIKLENGWTYKFILTVEDIPATQIFVKGNARKHVSHATQKHQEKVSSLLKKRISKILEIALKPKKHIGYQIVKKQKKLKTGRKDLEMKLVGIISGDMLRAEKIFLINTSTEPITVNLDNFMKEENLAVYLTKTEIMPGEQSVLVVVSED